MKILGISCFYHDSAAALVIDGEIIAAAQEERFTRKKHDASFPVNAIQYVLREAGISAADIDQIAFYDKPFLKFERLLESVLQGGAAAFPVWIQAIPSWLDHKLMIKTSVKKHLPGLNEKVKFTYVPHHMSHAAASFYPSPYKDAAILAVDGVGEWATTSWGTGSGNEIKIHKEITFPHSLGMLYSAITYYTGFKVNSGEYKVMGLAPYGEPEFTGLMKKHLIDIKDDGSFRLNMDYFGYAYGLRMTTRKMDELFGAPPRRPESELTQREMNLARSVQEITEEIFLKLGNHIHKQTKQKNLVIAGGVALNCVANGRLLREGPFENIWVQPAAGDAGSALGAALFTWYALEGKPRKADGKKDFMKGSYLGPAFSSGYIKKYLDTNKIPYKEYKTSVEAAKGAAKLVAQEKVIGFFSGRMEFGPRALGARSIVGDPRSEKMQSVMNLKIKFRESFRPFAPAVLREKVGDYFEHDAESDYMLMVAPVKKKIRIKMTADQEKLFGIDKLNVKRSALPAITHVDYSARIQTVGKENHPPYRALIEEFNKITKCPVIINTSFNVRGEPIVHTPEEAYLCFMRTGMDSLVLENFILNKEDQPELKKDSDWQKEFELD